MKKKKMLFFIFLFVGMFLFQHDLVNAYIFYARFFPGQDGYLKFDAKNSYESSKDQGKRDQGKRKIDSEQDTNLTNYYVRDGCEFVGWVAERNDGATWYCKEGEAANCGSENNYAIYLSDANKKYQTGEDGKNAGFHAVWKCNDKIYYPLEMGKKYEYYDVQYETVEESDYLGSQSVIKGQENKLMDYNIDNFDGWNVLIQTTNWFFGTPEKKWYCGDGKELSTNCRSKYVARNKTVQAGNNGDFVVYVATIKNYKPTYTIVYLSYEDDEVHYSSNCNDANDCAYEDVLYDTDIKLNADIFQREGKIIGGWYLYIYRYDTSNSEFRCYNKNRKPAGRYPIFSPEDYRVKFDSEFCKSPVKVQKNDKINIPFDSEFTKQDFRWSKTYGSYPNTDNYVLFAQAIWVDGESTTGYSDEDICKQQGNIWIKKGDSGYCSIDGLLYLKCGDIDGFPEVIPKISSYFVTLLKTVAPIVLIIFSIISLAKAISAGKEDEIKKAQTTLVKKIIIGALIFFVVTIVQFIMLKVADSSEKDNLTKCLSCFLNGTDDDNCNSIYYKHRGDSGTIEYKKVNK